MTKYLKIKKIKRIFDQKVKKFIEKIINNFSIETKFLNRRYLKDNLNLI